MDTIEGDRRRHARIPLTQPCKVYDSRSGKYYAGTTQNVSHGGMLIDLPRLLDMQPGETLHVGVAMKRRQNLLRSDEMIKMIVARILQTVDDHTALGLRFEGVSADAAPAHSELLAAA